MKIVLFVTILFTVCCHARGAGTGPFRPDSNASILAENFTWNSAGPILAAPRVSDEEWIAVKDPSVIRHQGRWHVFCTVRGRKRTHAIVYLSFDQWSRAAQAGLHVLRCHGGYFCAPQVFYFSPQKKWYLVCQASDEKWSPEYQAAYCTTTDIAAPESWTPLQPLGANQADGKSGLDFWIICDDTRAHLFFTTLDGRMWREQTGLEAFPGGWSSPSLALRGDIFEASHIYKLRGTDSYLTLVEAQNGHGWRYYKAYLADRLDGPWRPLAADSDTAFASMKNVRQTGTRWTDCVSHGELIRAGHDQRLEVDPAELRFLFQGVMDRDRQGKKYGEIPWRLGMLEPRP